ncbi:MAG TPA: ATP-binding protein [Chitinophagaceae bacterium]|nr:ATP-binding protein [Chitinophagaceae bacterium]
MLFHVIGADSNPKKPETLKPENQNSTSVSASPIKRLFSGKKDKGSQKSFNLFAAVFENSADAHIIYDKSSLEIININKQTALLLGISGEHAFEGWYMTRFFTRYLAMDSPNLERLMNRVSEAWEGEAEFVNESKKKIYTIVTTNIVTEVPAGFELQILRIRDMTPVVEARKEVKRTMIFAERAAGSKARFLSTMSHELRTPLNGIIGAANLALLDESLSSDARKHIGVMKYSSEHMLDIINDILDFSKIDAGKMEFRKNAFNLKESIDDVITFFDPQYHDHDLALTTDFDIDALKQVALFGDQMKLNQVIKNLLSNALKFTLAGEVKLSVRVKENTAQGILIYFEVKDTGIGIPKEKQDEIFHAFSQIHSDNLRRKYEGTGLGLAISKKLVEIMGGTLEVDSEEGKGSKFFFTLPFTIAARSSANHAENANGNHPVKDIRGLRILIAEDNEINANILKGFLQRWQMQIKVAITGVHAVELLKYHKFDLVLMDLEMPEMNGYDALRKIREQGIHVPVFAFTATLLENMDSLVKEAGFTDYVLKPFKPAELKKKIEKYCERKIDYA